MAHRLGAVAVPTLLEMSFRRTKQAATEHRAWQRFVEAHGGLIRSIGIPDTITASRASWWYFLDHGNHPDDLSQFSSHLLSHEKLVLLVELIAEYCQFVGSKSTTGWCVFPHQRYTNELHRRLGADAESESGHAD